jgi:amino acid transporter
VGLGSFLGIFVPTVCSIFGVVVFLRMGLLVGMAGLSQTVLIVTTSFGLAGLTVLSLCALMTNSQQVGGGSYAAIRNSIGPKLGSAVGVMLYIAYTVSIAFFVVGFAEISCYKFGLHHSWASMYLGSSALLLMLPIALKGWEFTGKSLLVVLTLFFVALVFSLGCLLLHTADKSSGTTELSTTTFKENLHSDYIAFADHQENSFWVSGHRVCITPKRDCIIRCIISSSTKRSKLALPQTQTAPKCST